MFKLAHLKQFKHVFDASYYGISILDSEGIILLYNKAAGAIVNKDPDQMMGKPLGDIFPRSWAEIREIIRSGTPQHGRKMTLENDVTMITYRNPIFKDDRIIGAISVFQGISEYEERLEELDAYMKLSKKLDAVIDSSYDGLWIFDNEGKVLRLNRASEKINDLKAEMVIGRRAQDLVHEKIIDRSAAVEVINKKEPLSLMRTLANGKQVLVTGNPIFDEDGQLILVVSNERDITELNRLRADLEKTLAITEEYHNELSQLYQRGKIFSNVVIRSSQMHKVLDTVTKVATFDTTVLIQGESGVGKSLFARLLHQASSRADGPFIRVDCGAIPEALIESELFGYEPGAFTGARAGGKPGHFEMAEAGTLFLDDIGEIPLSTQVKLLRFMEEGELIHIGATTPKKVNTRIVASTNRDLEEMVRTGLFRKDLFFRLNVVPLRIPPLRERTEDIPPLAHFFLQKFNSNFSTNTAFLPQAMDCIRRYSFQGNIRELSNLIEQLVVLNPQKDIDIEDLPAHVRACSLDYEPPFENGWSLRRMVEALEKRAISRALASEVNQRKAAAALGMSQSTLARKAKKYGISADPTANSTRSQ